MLSLGVLPPPPLLLLLLRRRRRRRRRLLLRCWFADRYPRAKGNERVLQHTYRTFPDPDPQAAEVSMPRRISIRQFRSPTAATPLAAKLLCETAAATSMPNSPRFRRQGVSRNGEFASPAVGAFSRGRGTGAERPPGKARATGRLAGTAGLPDLVPWSRRRRF